VYVPVGRRRGWPRGRNCTTSRGTRQTSWTSSTEVLTPKWRSTSQYCMVNAWLWLWFVMTFVTISLLSDAVARRTLVRAELRRAAAWRASCEWKSWVAFET